jgi:hypothetical protein
VAASRQDCGNVRDLFKDNALRRRHRSAQQHQELASRPHGRLPPVVYHFRPVVINVWSESRAWSDGSSILPSCYNSEREKYKGKVHPRTGHESPEGKQKYTSALSLTSALDVGGWSMPRSGRFTRDKETRHPLYRRLGGPKGRSGRVWKISPPPGFDPRTVQPGVSPYTD